MPGRVVMFADPDGAAYQLAMILDQDLNMGDVAMLKGIYFLYCDNSFYTSLLEIETIHPIPQKYIPALDVLIMNGADGKQYIVTVNESGALVATQKT